MTDARMFRIYAALEIAGTVSLGRIVAAIWNDPEFAALALATAAWFTIGAVLHVRDAWRST
jgi:hypothetical protein